MGSCSDWESLQRVPLLLECVEEPCVWFLPPDGGLSSSTRTVLGGLAAHEGGFGLVEGLDCLLVGLTEGDEAGLAEGQEWGVVHERTTLPPAVHAVGEAITSLGVGLELPSHLDVGGECEERGPQRVRHCVTDPLRVAGVAGAGVQFHEEAEFVADVEAVGTDGAAQTLLASEFQGGAQRLGHSVDHSTGDGAEIQARRADEVAAVGHIPLEEPIHGDAVTELAPLPHPLQAGVDHPEAVIFQQEGDGERVVLVGRFHDEAVIVVPVGLHEAVGGHVPLRDGLHGLGGCAVTTLVHGAARSVVGEVGGPLHELFPALGDAVGGEQVLEPCPSQDLPEGALVAPHLVGLKGRVRGVPVPVEAEGLHELTGRWGRAEQIELAPHADVCTNCTQSRRVPEDVGVEAVAPWLHEDHLPRAEAQITVVVEQELQIGVVCSRVDQAGSAAQHERPVPVVLDAGDVPEVGPVFADGVDVHLGLHVSSLFLLARGRGVRVSKLCPLIWGHTRPKHKTRVLYSCQAKSE